MRALPLALLFLILGAAPALAQPQDDPSLHKGELAIEPEEINAGEAVTVVGFGCAPNNQVRFDLYDPDLSSSADATAGSDGTFAQSVKIPPGAGIGRTWIQATCLTGDLEERVMEGVLLVNRPDFQLTGVSISFGLGTALVVFGLGLLLMREPSRSRSARGRRR